MYYHVSLGLENRENVQDTDIEFCWVFLRHFPHIVELVQDLIFCKMP